MFINKQYRPIRVPVDKIAYRYTTRQGEAL